MEAPSPSNPSGAPFGPSGAARAREVELILSQLDTLPTLSPIATRLLAISSSEDYKIDEVSRLIEADPSLTARILGLCRRADRGLGDRITTVRRAIVMLGIEAVRGAVLSVSVYELMDRTAHERDDGSAEGRPFDREGFWRHAIGVASAAELIAQTRPIKGAKPEDAFVAGLLHDLGKMILDVVLPRAYGRVIDLAERRRSNAAPVEREIVGLDHHSAGRRVAAHWNLPEALRDVMWLHSQPPEAIPDTPHRPLVALVSLAKIVCREMHIGWSGDFAPTPTIEQACAMYGYNAARVNDTLPRLHAAVAERCKVLGLGEETSPVLLLRSIFAANQGLARLNAALEQRTALADRTREELDAVQAFLARGRQSSIAATIAEVARSATDILGAFSSLIVYSPEPGAPWELHRLSEGTLAHDLAPEPAFAPELADLLATGHDFKACALVRAWLGKRKDAAARGGVSIPILAPGESAGAWAVLLCHGGASGEGEKAIPPALREAWRSALASASTYEYVQHLGEKLVEANRGLAAAQARLTETASMARLGEMTAGAAHEMNNPLTIISGRAQLLAVRLANTPDASSAEAIVHASSQLSDLITSLNLLANPPEPKPAPTPIDELLREAARRAEERTSIAARVRIECAFDPGSTVVVDREMLIQALCELISNALEAGGTEIVRVCAEEQPRDSRWIVSIHDRGTGMSSRALQHAFDPFFSEKPAGRKRGLGLTRARRLVELHGGEVQLRSTPGEGTEAVVSLPRMIQAMRHAA